jgi:hypothetical protein
LIAETLKASTSNNGKLFKTKTFERVRVRMLKASTLGNLSSSIYVNVGKLRQVTV